jgi:hypothetical protein
LKKASTYKGVLPYQSEFSRRYACWARNHRGWSKMKRYNKRLAKRRLRHKDRQDLMVCEWDGEERHD